MERIMSVRAMVWAWEQECSPVEQLMLLAMSDSADDDGVVHYIPEGMAKKLRMTQEAFSLVLGSLVLYGMVEPHAVDPSAPDGYVCHRLCVEV
jgi:hypothetical protein